ncbi:MAG: MBOAT family O-acyltransferase, partial [Bacteroidota bacterium]|nr:MBOAT family O-acyltransferase [Bacteroidota bacterium]
FSRDIAEFWRRWHISLSTWFRDYVYIPLGGSRGGTWMKIRNTFIIFIVSGFWHGANWTFIIWGALNALYFLPLMLTNKNRKHLDLSAKQKTLPTVKEFFQIAFTFSLTVLAWIFFRAENITHALSILSEIFSMSLFSIPDASNLLSTEITNRLFLVFYISILTFVEWLQKDKKHGLENILKKNQSSHKIFKKSIYFVLGLLIILNISNEAVDFIYFQF